MLLPAGIPWRVRYGWRVAFFESLLILLALAVVLLQFTRRWGLPYPAMLATAGLAVAAIPGMPAIPIDPHLALALFIAPVLIDAAYDFPIATARKLAAPLILYAVVAVLVTAGLVAWLAHATIGLPLAAAVTLGAIVAPPDAAAATAVLANLPVSRRIEAVLKGESLFNDATALLLFGASLAIQSHGSVDGGTIAGLALAAPGGILFGVAFGFVVRRLQPFVDNSVAGTISQFLYAFATWIIAERLHLSAVLATVASAMTIATMARVSDPPRMRVHSFAVWTTVVFLLNVLAFLLMGMQARTIVAAMSAAELARALWFSAAVAGVVIVTRVALAFAYRPLAAWRHRIGRGLPPVLPAESLLVGWTGMRGLVTLATAFALPGDFPQRGTVVLAAFTVVIATLVVQGATLAPLIRLLGLGREAEAREEIERARKVLAEAALARLEGEAGAEAEALRVVYRDLRDGSGEAVNRLDRHHGLALAAVLAQREALDALRATHRLAPEAYLQLQEALDWKQLAIANDDERRLIET